MPNLIDLTGRRFGRWLVIESARGYKRPSWRCVCDCGTERVVQAGNLREGKSLSCGCLKREKTASRLTRHGMTNTKTWVAWRNMLARCRPNHKNREVYFARGITVCARWQSFENFFADMGESPEGMTLERIDNSSGYCKENCKWASMKEQSNNRRTNQLLRLDGQRMTTSQWSERLGVEREIIRGRIRGGWTDRDALTKPKGYRPVNQASP